MRLRFRKIDPSAALPTYAHPGDAGMDVRALEEATLPPGARALVRTGLVALLEEGWELQVRPRSGLAFKHGVTVLNSPGTIDAGYRGEIGVLLVNLGEAPYRVEKGDKVAQLVLAPVARAEIEAVEEQDETARGAGGFGSTGV